MNKIINPWDGLDGYFCFGCAPNNPFGLHLEFFEDGDDIVACWNPQAQFQGWLNTLHGGIITTLMDELAGWVVMRKLQTAGMTSRLDARFLKSVSTNDTTITIRGRIKDRKRNAIFIETEVYNQLHELCARADIVYFIATHEHATEWFHFKECKIEGE